MSHHDRAHGADERVLPALSSVRGPAMPIADDRAEALIASAVGDWTSTRTPWRRLLAAAAVLLVLASGTSVAVAIWAIATSLGDRVESSRSEAGAPPRDRSAHSRRAHSRQEPVAVPFAPIAGAPEAAEVAEVAVPAGEEAEPAAPHRGVHRGHAARDRAPRPGELLEHANGLRAARAWPDAERAYSDLARRFGRTPEAYAATVAAASLRLDHLHDPRGARALFRRALRERPRGHLAEEARFGIAESERALGDRGAEREALRSLLEAHPRTTLRRRVEARLRELDQRAP